MPTMLKAIPRVFKSGFCRRMLVRSPLSVNAWLSYYLGDNEVLIGLGTAKVGLNQVSGLSAYAPIRCFDVNPKIFVHQGRAYFHCIFSVADLWPQALLGETQLSE